MGACGRKMYGRRRGQGGRGSVDERVRLVLSGCGQGQEWMRKLEEMRERAGCMR